MLPQVSIWGYAAQTYYLCAAIAGLCGIGLAAFTLRKEFPDMRRFVLPALVAVLALIGARLFNFLLNPGAYGADFPAWSLSYRNLSLMGGLIMGVLTVCVFGIVSKRNPFRLLDAFVLPAGVGIALLKLGCFLNGCCFGKPASGPFSVTFPANQMLYAYLDTLPLLGKQARSVYPAQLFEMSGAMIGLALIWYICRKRNLPDGARAIFYAAWFTLVRLAVHQLRSFPYEKQVVAVFYPLFYCAVLLALIVTLVILLKQAFKKGDT